MNKLPDLERHMAEVQSLATEARETPPGPTTSGPKVAAPIYMGNEKDIIPTKYVIHYAFVQCTNCGHATRESEFYAMVHLRSRLGAGRVRHLVKCSKAVFNIPVEKVLTGCHKIPYCQACDKIDLSHLPPPPEPTLITTFPEMRMKGQKPKDVKPAKEPTKPATLDDLI